MIIKKFVAETMNDALIQVRKELGEDAVILQSRKVEKGGLFSFLSREMVEVTAATPDSAPPPVNKNIPMDEGLKRTLTRSAEVMAAGQERDEFGVRFARSRTPDLPRNKPTEEKSPHPRDGVGLKRKNIADQQPAGGSVNHAFRSYREQVDTPEVKAERKKDSTFSAEGYGGIQSELTELRATVHQLAKHLKYHNAPALPELLAEKWFKLVENGVSEKKAHDILQKLHIELGKDELNDNQSVNNRLLHEISLKIKTGRINLQHEYTGPYVVALIGPTGVGKTTTLAKMATNRRVFGKMRVALLTTDTYRIAAVEQLKTFASIAGIPLEVVYRPEEMISAINRHQDKDVILVDTAGRSQTDAEALQELKEFIDVGNPDEVVLALSAGTRLEDQEEMVRSFGVIPSTSMILTKLDEVTSVGHLLELSELCPKNWVYITTGQNVPDDIVHADIKQLAKMITDKQVFQNYRSGSFKNY